ncbi:aquaporin [Diaporthe helianthi]|uniref:Aquaporin n=1 Tax=Diaporthe helianthi TaxID=158607 RepID=A0A2P5ICW2_DIAHE|nr:aquaporin [Diaporthe helianthi]
MPPRPWQRGSSSGPESNGEALISQPLGRRVPAPAKAHIAAATSEFVGTFLFLLFALGATHTVNTSPSALGGVVDIARLLYISLAFGISLAVNVWTFFHIEGGMFNPAVAIAMFATGGFGLLRLGLVIVAQLLGSIAASALVVGLLPGDGIAATTGLADDTSIIRGLFIEAFLTAELVFVIFMLATEKHRSTAVAPVGIGLALFICELMGVRYTGGSLNPARSFGPEVVTKGGFPGYHWIYWVGPILGALLAAGFYKFVKAMEFDQISPNIDEPAYKKSGPAAESNGAHEVQGEAA